MKNPYTYTLGEVLGILPELRDEVESIVDQIAGYNENLNNGYIKQTMEKRRLENEENKSPRKEKLLPFDMGL